MKTVMIVDDEPMVRRVLRMALERAGYDVMAKPDGQQAIAALRERAPDALITDIEMPVMTGEQLCKTIAKEMPERSFPIFVATSVTATEHREWSSQIPNLFFLEKPLSAKRLLAALTKHFETADEIEGPVNV